MRNLPRSLALAGALLLASASGAAASLHTETGELCHTETGAPCTAPPTCHTETGAPCKGHVLHHGRPAR